LTEGDIPPAQLAATSHIDIADHPFISMKDIVTYNAQTHELKLTAGAFENIANLDVPVSGRSFVVCVDRNVIYCGAFWTPVSSLSFDGITIWKPLVSHVPYIVTLELGYPSLSFYGGVDPRNNPEIMKSFEQAGKLITGLLIVSVDELPDSMKGYELYSWQENDQWQFTLITGTNRNKTLEEIAVGADVISEDGWVRVRVAGVDAIELVLSKIPQNQSVLWLAELREESAEQSSVNITLPPESIVNTIKEYAGQRGLDFVVQSY